MPQKSQSDERKASLSAVLCRQGEVNGSSLKAAQSEFDQEPKKKRKLMQLCLDPSARCGQADAVNEVLHSLIIEGLPEVIC